MLLDWSIALDANNPLSKKGYLQCMLLSCRKAPFYKLHLEDIILQLYGQVDDSLFIKILLNPYSFEWTTVGA